MNENSENSGKVKIRVYPPGTHAGKRYNPGPDGLELEVSQSQADALKKRDAHKKPSVATHEHVPSPPAGPAAERLSAPGVRVAEVPAAETPVTTRPRG